MLVKCLVCKSSICIPDEHKGGGEIICPNCSSEVALPHSAIVQQSDKYPTYKQFIGQGSNPHRAFMQGR